MKSFYVINGDFNTMKFEPYNIIPYLIEKYNGSDNKPNTFEEFKEFIVKWSRYQFWARAQYEIIISAWPPTKDGRERDKWDIHRQIMMNLDIITEIVMSEIKCLNM